MVKHICHWKLAVVHTWNVGRRHVETIQVACRSRCRPSLSRSQPIGSTLYNVQLYSMAGVCRGGGARPRSQYRHTVSKSLQLSTYIYKKHTTAILPCRTAFLNSMTMWSIWIVMCMRRKTVTTSKFDADLIVYTSIQEHLEICKLASWRLMNLQPTVSHMAPSLDQGVCVKCTLW